MKVRKELNNSQWQRQQEQNKKKSKHSGARLYIFISTSYIAPFYCERSDENVQAMLLYGAKKGNCV